MAFKSPEAVLVSALENDASVAAEVGQRIYPVLAPATAELPFIAWRRVAVAREQTLGGPMGMATVSLAVELYDTTYAAVRELADMVRVVLDGYGATVENTEVKNVSLDNEADGFVQLAGGDLPPVYVVTQTYSIRWQET
jgi:hypothetical protein